MLLLDGLAVCIGLYRPHYMFDALEKWIYRARQCVIVFWYPTIKPSSFLFIDSAISYCKNIYYFYKSVCWAVYKDPGGNISTHRMCLTWKEIYGIIRAYSNITYIIVNLFSLFFFFSKMTKSSRSVCHGGQHPVISPFYYLYINKCVVDQQSAFDIARTHTAKARQHLLLNRLIHSAMNLLLLRNTIDRGEGGIWPKCRY